MLKGFRGAAIGGGFAALALSACATAQPAPNPQRISPLELSTCRPDGVEEDVRCGVFVVPENRAAPNGRMLALKVVVIPARHPSPDRTPIFFLAGGPGQAAAELAQFNVDSWEREEHDLVLINVRGSGGDNRLDCPPTNTDPQTYLNPPFSDVARYRNCRAALAAQADLTQYTTQLAMQDVDDVRQALGYDKINLYGISYGTRAALTYLHYHGEHVRSVYLSGIAPLANRNPLYHAGAAQRAVQRLTAQCAADAACHAAFPDVLGDLTAVYEGLRAQPAQVTVTRPRDGASVNVSLSAGGFFEGLRVMLYDSAGARQAPYLLQQARAGNLTPFAEAALGSSSALDDALRMGLLLAVTCSEDIPRINEADIVALTGATFMSDVRVRNQMAACEGWPRATLSPDFYAAFSSDVPVLLVSGDLDPVTPPDWGEVARQGLSNSVHLVTPGAHGEGGDCVDAIAQQMFRTGTVAGLDTSCIAALTLPGFVLSADDLPQGQ